MIGHYNFLLIVLAYLVGSFLNVVISRLNKTSIKYNIVFPRSHCPHCLKSIAPYHNIPIFSYLYLRGRCADCQKPIAKRYLFVELLYPLLIWIALWTHPSFPNNIFVALFIGLLLIQTMIDLETQTLPDLINYLIIWSGLMVNSLSSFTSLEQAVFAAILGYMSLWGFYHLVKALTGKEGFGYGDFKLFAGIGAWLGIGALFPVLFLASLLGIIIGGLHLFCKKSPLLHVAIPFGPYLSLAAYLVLIFPQLVRWI